MVQSRTGVKLKPEMAWTTSEACQNRARHERPIHWDAEYRRIDLDIEPSVLLCSHACQTAHCTDQTDVPSVLQGNTIEGKRKRHVEERPWESRTTQL